MDTTTLTGPIPTPAATAGSTGRLTIGVGLGYLGAVHAACMVTDLGHRVMKIFVRVVTSPGVMTPSAPGTATSWSAIAARCGPSSASIPSSAR
jgi:hypothetical protein